MQSRCWKQNTHDVIDRKLQVWRQEYLNDATKNKK